MLYPLRARAVGAEERSNPASASFASGVEVGVDELWLRMDVDGDGVVTLDEIQALAKALGARMKKKQLKEMFADVDKDSSGTIDLEEFSVWWTACKRGGAASEDVCGHALSLCLSLAISPSRLRPPRDSPTSS